MKPEFASPDVARAFDQPGPEARKGLLQLRSLIYQAAADLPEAGTVEETLRWGQPAYLAAAKSGTTIRLGVHKQACFALFVHCQSRVIPDYIAAFPAWDRLDGTRAVLFGCAADIEPMRHGWLIRHALTYKLGKNRQP
jgi:hypothetical protein